MNKVYKLMIALNLMIVLLPLLQAKDVTQDSKNNCSCRAKNFQQDFIAKNGELGIYQPNRHKAYIDDHSYIRVKAVLTNGPKKLKKPWNSIPLGKLIDGDNIYELYGKDENPAPVNDGPDADVRTEMKIDEDFMRNFGSGKYTPDDKWD